MKKILMLMLLVAVSVSLFAQSKESNNSSISFTGGYEYTPSSKTYTAKKATRSKQEPVKTEYKYQDRKGVEHDIYISSRGRCFYYVTNKEGKQDKRYLPKELSMEIATKMNIKYEEDGK